MALGTLVRYVGLAMEEDGQKYMIVSRLGLQHTREFELNSDYYHIGDMYPYYDPNDRRTYTYKLLRMEGTVNNKTKQQVERERREREVATI